MPQQSESRTTLWRTGFPLLLLAAGILLAGLLLWQLTHLLLLVFAAILIAVLLRAVAGVIETHTPLGPKWSLAMTIVALILLFAVFATLLGTQIRSQIGQLIDRIPEIMDRLEQMLGVENLEQQISERVASSMEEASVVANIAGYSSIVLGVAAEVLLVLVAGVYLAARPELYRNGFLILFPEKLKQEARETFDALGEALRLWLLGQLLAMAMVGVLTTFGLWLLGVPSALALGLIAGLLEFVPYVGPIVTAVPTMAVAAAEEPTKALWVAGLFLLIQQIEGNLIMPLVQQRTVDLPPVLTIFAVVAFATLFGVLGLLFATPLAVVCFVLVKKLWVRDTLDEETTLPGETEGEA